MKKRALISVSDKTGIVEFARGLQALGYEIVSTGGSASALRGAGVEIKGVSEITGFPECLDGRLKTLHPMVHGGILAVRSDSGHMAQLESLGIAPIDVLAINLYPFKQTIAQKDVSLEQAIENIDIGGPAMIRAAAKNWRDVTVVTDPRDYDGVLSQLRGGGVSKEAKYRLACKVFEYTAHYDAMISSYLRRRTLGDGEPDMPELLTLTYERAQSMRYGENPHQSAMFYKEVLSSGGSVSDAVQLHGKELSFNNINDANGAVMLIKEFSEPCAVAVKHANPCGVAVAQDIFTAYKKAYEADPMSIYGGIVALNRECDGATAAELNKIFVEIIIAPSYSDEAFKILSGKKNIRILRLGGISLPVSAADADLKKVSGGLLVQGVDDKLLDCQSQRTVTKAEITDAQRKDLSFAWRVVKHVKSNAIVLAKDGATVGIGPGQTNRITALELAVRYAGGGARGAVMASDAYFPFSDCVEAAGRAGITAIIQPGGSVRDGDSIAAADEAGIAMMFTNMRHFKH